MYTSGLEIFMQEREIREGKSLHDRSRDYDLPALEATVDHVYPRSEVWRLKKGKFLAEKRVGNCLIFMQSAAFTPGRRDSRLT
jgi:hypothetical protein